MFNLDDYYMDFKNNHKEQEIIKNIIKFISDKLIKNGDSNDIKV